VALGYNALSTQNYSNGGVAYTSNNIAIGYQAMRDNNPTATANGIRNIAIGSYSMLTNTTGYGNTAVGYEAANVLTTGTYNTCIGHQASPGAAARNNSIALAGNGNLPVGADNMVRIGNAAMGSIGGQVGWTTVSDARSKQDVREEVIGIDFIMKLRPVTFAYDVDAENEVCGISDSVSWNSKYDIEKIRFSGFIAQDVEKAADECGYSFSGVDKPKSEGALYGLRYAEFTVPLVKAVQEQQTLINQQAEIIQKQEERILQLEGQMKKVLAKE
jgi:hypothetical protein